MTLEQALIAALTAVVSALCFVCKILWSEMKDCKADRSWLRRRVEVLEGEGGIAKGKVEIYERCHQRECPFRGLDSAPQAQLP